MHDLGKIVYLDNFKTGSSLITDFINKCSSLKIKYFSKHKLISNDFRNDTFYFTTVRDPFDTYVSRFRYGCDGKDGIFLRMRAAGFADLYKPTNEAFHEWLEFVFDPANAKQMNDGYPLVAKLGIGLNSYLHLIFSIRHTSARLVNIKSASEFDEIYEKEKIVSLVMKNENLNDELRHFATVRFPEYFDQELVELYFSRNKRVNASESGNVSEFTFTPQLREKILEREHFLISRFYPELL